MIKSTITLIALLLITRTCYCFEFPNNPCPSIFDYIYNGRHWFGHITVPAPPPSANVAVISANFSIKGSITSYGPIKLDEYDKATEKIKNGQPLKFIVTFPKSKHLPQVTQIEFNDNILCVGPKVSAPSSTSFWLQYTFNWTGVFNPQNTQIYYTIPPQTHQTLPSVVTIPPKPNYQQLVYDNPIIFPTYPKTTAKPVVSKPKKFNNYKECGTIREKRSADDDDFTKRIINGTLIARNSHPWLVALFDVSQRREFFCAGNLISNKHALTAAHCTIVKNHRNIQATLGVHNTNNLFDPGSLNRMVISVLQHPDYRAGQAFGDMSLLVMDNEVEFTSAIKPICLWNYDSDFRAIIGYSGTIMGWGTQENGDPSTIPMKTDVTITTKQKCKEVDLLKNFVTDKTFCAGRKGTGPCMGDSGGGLFLSLDGKWYLRGIISTSIADKYTQICYVDTYSVYVDTAKYMDWIVNNMEQN